MPDDNAAPTDANLVEILREISILIQKDPTNRARFQRILAGDSKQDVLRAILWTKAANVPYYKEHFAREIQTYVDQMIVDRKPIEWRYASFPRLARVTLKHKIYQSFLWLVDCGDVKYLKLKNETEIAMTRTGIRLRFVKMPDMANPAPIVIDDEEKADSVVRRWRADVDEYLTNGEIGSAFEKKRLKLSDDDVNDLKMSLSMLPSIRFIVTPDRIKIIKPTPEQLEAMKGMQ